MFNTLASMHCTCLFIFKTIYSRIRRLSCVQRWSGFCAIVQVKSKFVKYGGVLFHGFCSYCSRTHEILVLILLILHSSISPFFLLLSSSSPFPSSISPLFPHLYPFLFSLSFSISPSPSSTQIRVPLGRRYDCEEAYQMLCSKVHWLPHDMGAGTTRRWEHLSFQDWYVVLHWQGVL